jgi:hypothetical protein
MKLKLNHPAVIEARTIHTGSRRQVTDAVQVLKPASANSKLGKGLAVIMKGAWKGFPLFTLTLEERATCPPNCERWRECYGNGMAFAHRFEAGSTLEAKIRREVAALAALYPHGFAIRLHILGDFYSVPYVEMWAGLMENYPMLHVYGYTARNTGAIADSLRMVRTRYGSRWWVRISSSETYSGRDIFASHDVPFVHGIVCPEQTGKTASCLTCGLCWSTSSTIKFIDHDVLAKQRKEQKNATLEQ